MKEKYDLFDAAIDMEAEKKGTKPKAYLVSWEKDGQLFTETLPAGHRQEATSLALKNGGTCTPQYKKD